MKLRLLKGIVFNVCDSVSSPPFSSVKLSKEKLPVKDTWLIDLKNNLAKNEKGELLKLSFVEDYHNWFLRQIQNANIPLEKIGKAELLIRFNFKNKKQPNWCSCTIEIENRKYYYEKDFHIFWFLG